MRGYRERRREGREGGTEHTTLPYHSCACTQPPNIHSLGGTAIPTYLPVPLMPQTSWTFSPASCATSCPPFTILWKEGGIPAFSHVALTLPAFIASLPLLPHAHHPKRLSHIFTLHLPRPHHATCPPRDYYYRALRTRFATRASNSRTLPHWRLEATLTQNVNVGNDTPHRRGGWNMERPHAPAHARTLSLKHNALHRANILPLRRCALVTRRRTRSMVAHFPACDTV